MKRTIILAAILIIGVLLISSCKPAGRAIAQPDVTGRDLDNFPSNLFHEFDLEQMPIPVKIYTDLAFANIANQLVAEIEVKMCEGMQTNGEGCSYTFEPDFIDSIDNIPRFIAIGTCDDETISSLLDDSTCEDLVEHKALIQYVETGQLVIAGGTEADAIAAVDTLMAYLNEGVYLNGYYSDIINTENLIAASHITPTNEVKYTAQFMFKEGTNVIMSPLEIPYDKETVTAFFGANIDKINKIYLYDTDAGAYMGVYNPDTDVPSNIVNFAERDYLYVVDAKEDFDITVFGAEPPAASLAGYYNVPLDTKKVLNAFITGAAVNSITGGAVAGQVYATDPLYQCRRTSPVSQVHDYYVSLVYPCPVDDTLGILGRVYSYSEPQPANTVLLKYCYWPHHDDHLLAINVCDPDTQDQADTPNLGYVYATKPTGIDTIPLYRCIFTSNGEHFQTSINPCPDGSDQEGVWYMLPFCSETDQGKDLFTKGTTTGLIEQYPKTEIDTCVGTTRVEEAYCDSETLPHGVKEELLDCPSETTCQEGECVWTGEEEAWMWACRDDSNVGDLVYDHYVTAPTGQYEYKNACGTADLTQRIIGKVFKVPKQDTQKLTLCEDYTNNNDREVILGDCPPGTDILKEIGFVYITPQEGTIPATKCKFTANNEKFVINGNGCPSGADKLFTFYVMPFCTISEDNTEPGITESELYIGTKDSVFSLVDGDKTWYDECTNGKLRQYYRDPTNLEGNIGIASKEEDCPTDTICEDGKCKGQITKLLYRCYNIQHWSGSPTLLDHYVSFDPNCEGNNVDGPIGHIYQEEFWKAEPNLETAYQCHRQTRHHSHTWTDHFLSKDANCEGQNVDSLVGYLPSSSSDKTTTYYRCLGTEAKGGFDHLISSRIGCEGYVNEELEFYFLKEPVTTVEGAPEPSAEPANLTITKTGPATADAGEIIEYEIQITNPTENMIYFTLTEKIPDYTTYISNSRDWVPTEETDTEVAWEMGIPGKDGYSVDIRLKSDENTTNGTIITNEIEIEFNTKNKSATAETEIQSSITGPECGNGIIEAGEECDDGNLNSDTMPDACRTDCKLPSCGDSVVDTGEECDPPDGITCDANCMNITPPLPPGVPPLVPPPTPPPTLPPFPHQFYGNVINGVAAMPIQATLGAINFNTAVDTNIQYGYTPIFLITGTTDGALISFYVNNSFDQTYAFQQGALTQLDLTYTAGGAPPTGPTCTDGIQNQDETDVDCGGTVCPKCDKNENCTKNSDCKTNYCKNGVCKARPRPRVSGGGGGGRGRYVTAAQDLYGMPQQAETACYDDWICDPWSPCLDGIQTRECFLNDYPECLLEMPKPETTQSCVMPEPEYVPPAAPTCFDGIQNQDETFPDCGGSMCKPCDPNLPCRIDRDCVTNYCDPIAQMCSYPSIVETPKPPSRWWIWLIVALAAIGVIGGTIAAIVLLRKKEELPNHRLKDLREYVEKYKKKGVSTEKIRKKVLEHGWKKEAVEKVLK